MWKSALFATAAVLMGIWLLIFSQIDFLIPYKHVLVRQYGASIAIFFGLLAVNIYFFCFLIARLILLRDTGRKLIHIEKQLREGSIAHELSDRLSAEE
jgi:hypothetical protein